MKPHTSLIVCATPRTGSGLLCDALWNTGLAGRPDEYFCPSDEQEYSKVWGTSIYIDYLNKVIEEGTTPNGIFGLKIMWHHLNDFRERVSKISQFTDIKTHNLFTTLFPNSRYVWITLRDKVCQAVSLYRARKTGFYRWYEEKSQGYKKTLNFDFQAIDQIVHEIYKWERGWKRYFEVLGISPYTIVYERDLEYHIEETVKGIVAYIGVKIPDDFAPHTKYRKQSDELTNHFVRLYRKRAEKLDSQYKFSKTQL
jgi:trehalose 2-sulfotransferase